MPLIVLSNSAFVVFLEQVISVHMVSLTGVDFLFQDLDIIWFKHPLDFFHDKTSPIYSYDAIFQDGAYHGFVNISFLFLSGLTLLLFPPSRWSQVDSLSTLLSKFWVLFHSQQCSHPIFLDTVGPLC